MSEPTRLELIMLFAAGALDADEAQAVRAMIASGDPGVLAELAHAEAVLAQIPEALPMVDVPARAKQALRDRLAAAATADEPPAGSPMVVLSSAPKKTNKPSGGVLAKLGPWLAAAVLALLVGGAVWMVMSSQVQTSGQQLAELQKDLTRKEVDLRAAREQAEAARQTINALEGESAQRVGQIAKLESRINDLNSQVNAALARADSAERIVAAVQTPTSQAVALAGTDNQPGASARLIYDPAQRTAVLLTQNMKPAVDGEAYQLWVVTADERKVSVGTFAIGPDGTGTLVVDFPNDPGPVILAAVTNEPRGGSLQPTGSFQMLGEF